MADVTTALSDTASADAAAEVPAIEMIGVHKWFGELHVLRDIDLRVARGERVVVCGPSGSGKYLRIQPCDAQARHHVHTTFRISLFFRRKSLRSTLQTLLL